MSNRNAVEKSKQMPFQFYNAFNALTELEKSFDEFFDGYNDQWSKVRNSDAIKRILKVNMQQKMIKIVPNEKSPLRFEIKQDIETLQKVLTAAKSKHTASSVKILDKKDDPEHARKGLILAIYDSS